MTMTTITHRMAVSAMGEISPTASRPAMAFYPFNELGQDQTNWCGPNPACVVAMLKTVGFKRIEIVSGLRPFYFRIAKACWLKWKRRHQFWSMLRTDRIVIHAWK